MLPGRPSASPVPRFPGPFQRRFIGCRQTLVLALIAVALLLSGCDLKISAKVNFEGVIEAQVHVTMPKPATNDRPQVKCSRVAIAVNNDFKERHPDSDSRLQLITMAGSENPTQLICDYVISGWNPTEDGTDPEHSLLHARTYSTTVYPQQIAARLRKEIPDLDQFSLDLTFSKPITDPGGGDLLPHNYVSFSSFSHFASSAQVVAGDPQKEDAWEAYGWYMVGALILSLLGLGAYVAYQFRRAKV